MYLHFDLNYENCNYENSERDSLPRAAPPPTEQVPAVPNLAHMQRWENMRQQYQPVAGRMDEQTHNQRLQSEMQARLAKCFYNF